MSHLYLLCCQPPSSGKTPNFGTILHTSTTWGWIYRVCCSNGPNKIHSLANLTQKFVREIKMHFQGGNAISWNAYKWADFCKLLMTKMQMTLLFLAPLDYCWHWLKLNNCLHFFCAIIKTSKGLLETSVPVSKVSKWVRGKVKKDRMFWEFQNLRGAGCRPIPKTFFYIFTKLFLVCQNHS